MFMFIIRTMMMIVFGLFFSFAGLLWVRDTALAHANFATHDAYEDAYNLALMIVFPLAIASAVALVWRMLPVKKADDAG